MQSLQRSRLQGFLLGTRRALADEGRPCATLTLPCVDARQLGALIALFERAVTAGAEGRLSTARDLFQRSYDATPRAQTAYNLGLVLRELGELRRAAALLERVDGGEVEPDLRAALETLLTEVRGSVAVLEVALEHLRRLGERAHVEERSRLPRRRRRIARRKPIRSPGGNELSRRRDRLRQRHRGGDG